MPIEGNTPGDINRGHHQLNDAQPPRHAVDDQMPPESSAVHRTILAVDIAGFSDRRRTNAHQVAVRASLYQSLQTAFARSGIAWDDCYREDRGDGLFVLIPPNIPKSQVAAPLPLALAIALRHHNEKYLPEARIQLRAALHAGEVEYDEHGVAGTAINLTFRLLEATPLRAALAQSSGVLALIASDWFFEEVIRHDPASAPATYRRVQVAVKETATTGWVCRPDDAYPPNSDTAPNPAYQASASAAIVPRQLPATILRFVGRQDELAELTGLLDSAPHTPESTLIVTITGTAGVGKTALAVHWAHQVQDRFPDGQLFANLRGYDSGLPATPDQILDGFLRALRIPAENIPAGMEARAALYRSLVSGKRILTVLDNAASPEQVRPLLPASPGCLTIVTSRSRLSGLTARDDARRIGLRPLSSTEAVGLLRRVIGTYRVDADLDAAATLAAQCAHLPLALRIAAERAASHPNRPLSNLVAELAHEHRRLDVLALVDDESVALRPVLSWSYRALPSPEARMFRLLGLHRGPDISTPAAAALIGATIPAARDQLDWLASMHLVEETTLDRYHFHSLLRAFARERAEAEDTDRDPAVRRLLAWYLHTAEAADHVLLSSRRHRVRLGDAPDGCQPQRFDTYSEALQWCEVERANLVAATRHAADIGDHTTAWKIPAVLWGFFDLRKPWTNWITTLRISLASVQYLHDQHGEGFTLMSLGIACRDLHRFDEALTHLHDALAIYRTLDVKWSEGGALHKIGDTYSYLRRFNEALDCLQQALVISRDVDERWGEGRVLNSLGDTYKAMHHYAKAIGCYLRSLIVCREIGDRHGECSTLYKLGDVYRHLHRLDEACNYLQRALVICQAIGNQYTEGETLDSFGKIQHSTGNVDEAHRLWKQALSIFESLGDPRAIHVRARLTAA